MRLYEEYVISLQVEQVLKSDTKSRDFWEWKQVDLEK